MKRFGLVGRTLAGLCFFFLMPMAAYATDISSISLPTLFGVTGDDASDLRFSQVETQTGFVTPINTVVTAPDQSDPYPGVEATDVVTQTMFIIRRETDQDSIVEIETSTGNILNVLPLAQKLSHLGVDSRTGRLFGITEFDGVSSTFVHIDRQTGLFTLIAQYLSTTNEFVHPGVDATDPLRGRFFVTRTLPEQIQLLSIDIETGEILLSGSLGSDLLHMGFDTRMNLLAAVAATENNQGSDFVVFDPNTFVETILMHLGDDVNTLSSLGIDAVDNTTDRFFIVRMLSGVPTITTLNVAGGFVENDAPLSAPVRHLGSLLVDVPPFIANPLTAEAFVGGPFTLELVARGNPPPEIFVPTTIFWQIIAETTVGNETHALLAIAPTTPGVFDIPITASNAIGTEVQILELTVFGFPTIISTPYAPGYLNGFFDYPIVVTVGTPATFSASGLPIGLTLAGNFITGVPQQSGTFAVIVTASNPAGSDTQTLVLNIEPANDVVGPNAVPMPLVDTTPTSLTVNRMNISLNFATAGNDSVSLTGNIATSRGSVPAGQTVVLEIGPINQQFALNSKGQATIDGATLKMRARGRDNSNVSFSANFRNGNFTRPFENRFENADVFGTRVVPVRMTFQGTTLETDVEQKYVARKNRYGRAKKK